MKGATRVLVLAAVASAVLPTVSSLQDEAYERRAVQIRASVALPEESTAAVTTQAASAAPASTEAASSAVATTSPTAASASSAAPTSEASSSSAAQATATSAAASAAPSATTHPVTSSAVATTDSSGQVVTSYVEFTPTPSSAAPSSTGTSGSNSSSSDDSGGLSTGSIVGLSVAGGIAAIAIILFFVWKFTRKRFADFDDNEAIKWPELNAHNTDVHALPTNATGRAGFGPENDSDVNLTRAPSPGAYANSIAASSVPEVYGAGDPYAVPPLPHLNPSQPYHDDPGAYGQPAGYYDPYRGPVPNTFADTIPDGHPESIPMTQMARMRSPAPVVYDMQGRGSPVPQAAMGYTDERSRTPVPAAANTGMASPSPNPGYGYGPR